MEGSLAQGGRGDCILTCNWPNWKFDLASGETLVAGDRLRRYPVEVVDGEVCVDIADPPADAVAAAPPDALRACFPRPDYGRVAREIGTASFRQRVWPYVKQSAVA